MVINNSKFSHFNAKSEYMAMKFYINTKLRLIAHNATKCTVFVSIYKIHCFLPENKIHGFFIIFN